MNLKTISKLCANDDEDLTKYTSVCVLLVLRIKKHQAPVKKYSFTLTLQRDKKMVENKKKRQDYVLTG